MPSVKDYAPAARGRVTMWKVSPHGLWLPVARNRNQIQFSWGHIITKLFAGDNSYRPRAMYIEYENVVDPEDEVSIPSFGRDEGLEYYANLAADRDYLRVALTQIPLITIEPGYEDYFTDGVSGNVATFMTMSSGVTGVRDTEFSDTANSKVCGAALVATPTFADRTQDVILARSYLAVDEQVLKEPSHQIGVTWELVIG